MTAYFRFIIRYRVPVLLVLLLITVVAGAIMSQGVIASTIAGMFFGDNPKYADYLERTRTFGGNDVLIVAVQDAQPFAPENIDRLRRVVDEIKQIPTVRMVRSLLDAQHIKGVEGELIVFPYVGKARDEPDLAQTLFAQMRDDPLAGGILLSDDATAHAVMIEFDPEIDLPAEEGPTLVAKVIAAFTDAGYARENLRTVGFPAYVAAFMEQSTFNIKRLFPFVCLILLAAVWLMFHRFWPVAQTMLVALVAVIWTMGFAVLLDREISVLTSMVPIVILIISFSDVIHLCSAYLLELGNGKSKDEALLASGSDVGKACLLTSVTTFFGFIAVSFVPAPIFRILGAVLGFGVGIALLLAVTLTPILFSIIPAPKPWRAGATGHVQDILDRLLNGVGRFTEKRPRLIVLLFVALTAVSVFGITQLRIETDFAKRLDKNHPVRQDSDYFKNAFAGSTAVDVFIESDRPEGLFDPDLFARIDRFQQQVEQLPEVANVYSLVDLMATLHREMNVGEASVSRLPDSRAALAQYMLLFEMSGGKDLEQLIDSPRRTMHLVLQLPDEGVRNAYDTGEKARSLGAEILGDDAEVEVTGLIYLLGDWLDDLVAGQRRGLLFAVLAIAVMMVIGLRSLRVGLWSMAPNVLPLLVLGGYLGLFWDQIDSDILALGMVAVGIGVDDTIHFLMRFRIESRRQPDTAAAVRQTLHFSGRGIVITSVILIAGFAPFALSDYLSIDIMGTLLPMTLAVALAADLLLVPALVHLKYMRFKK